MTFDLEIGKGAESLGATPLEIAIRDLIVWNHEPFYGNLLLHFRRMTVDNNTKGKWAVPTAAVGIDNNEIVLIVNKDFFNTLTREERCAVLKHECQHIAHRHLTRRDLGDYDPFLANIAMDSVINQYNENLPEGCVDWKTIDGAVNNETWESRYRLLVKDQKNECPTCGGSGQKPQDGEDQNQNGQGNGEDQGENQDQNGNGQGQGQDGNGEHEHGNGHGHGDSGEPCPDCGGSGHGSKYGRVIDSHKFFGDTNGSDPDIADAKVKQAVRQSAEAAGIGNVPSEIREMLNQWAVEKTVNWRKVLKNWMAESFRRTRDLSPVRESLSVPGVFPGGAYFRLPEFDVFVDASGSISTNDFQKFMNEVIVLNKTLKATVNVHQWDTQIHHSEVFENRVPELVRHACGGTDVACVKEYAKKNKVRNLIIMTDGYFNEVDFTGYNVLWVYTTSHQKHKGKSVILKD